MPILAHNNQNIGFKRIVDRIVNGTTHSKSRNKCFGLRFVIFFLIHDERTVVDRLGRIADFRDVEPGVFQKLGSIESGTLNTAAVVDRDGERR